MTDRIPDETSSPAGELRAALANLIEAIDGVGSSDTDELRRVAAEQLDDLGRRPGGGDGEDDHDGPLDALRDAIHRFETDHPALTTAVNDVSSYLSSLGI